MGSNESMALQVALYILSVAAVVIAAVLVWILLRLRAQLDRFVAAAERLEAQLTPLARDTRVAVDHLRKLAEQAQQQLATVGAVGESLLAPARSVSRTIELLRTGGTAFLMSMWNGPRKTNRPTRATVLSTS
jgi:uncharacterized protein YoxC